MFRFLKKALSYLFPFYGNMTTLMELAKALRQLRVHAESVVHKYQEREAGLAFLTDMLDASGGFVWRKDANGGYLFANHPVRNRLLAPHMHEIDSTSDLSQAQPARTDAEILSGAPPSDSECSTFLKTTIIADQYTLECRQRTEFLELGTVMGRPMLVHTIRTQLIDDQGRLEGLIGFGMDIGVGSGDDLLDMVRSWKGEGAPVPIHPSVYVLPGKNGGSNHGVDDF